MNKQKIGSRKTLFRPLDFVVMAVGVAVCVLSFVAAASGGSGAPLLIVTSPTAEYLYPLDADQEVRIHGLEGDTEIEISNGQARYLASPCANKTCVAAHPVARNGEWSACLPNGIFMRVESRQPEGQGDIDIMSF